MNKLQQWREARFHALTDNDPTYYQGCVCIARVADPAECPRYVNITGTPFRLAFILRRGLDAFHDGCLYYCYGYQCGPYRQRTPGKYLRKKKPGMHDPTMTHMDDPYVVKVGDYLRDSYKYSRVVAIMDKVFPDTRFAYVKECDELPDDAVLWDVQEQQARTWADTDQRVGWLSCN